MARVDIRTFDLDQEKKECSKIARQLRYPQKVLDKIQNAKTVFELSRIMKTARSEVI